MILKGRVNKASVGLGESEEYVTVILIPLYEEEAVMTTVEGELSFGNPNEIAPWTHRDLQEGMKSILKPIVVEPGDG